ncbi:hypothetical protein CLOBL_47020 [Clostridium sp. BL-8]|nr:hypothetical protein CLOBL_47020 [Clostridium sp. BL-8]
MNHTGKLLSVTKMPDQKKVAEFGVEARYVRGCISPEALHSIINLYADKKLIINVNKIYPFTLDEIRNSYKDFENDPNHGKRII